jgi:hypothetical protein
MKPYYGEEKAAVPVPQSHEQHLNAAVEEIQHAKRVVAEFVQSLRGDNAQGKSVGGIHPVPSTGLIATLERTPKEISESAKEIQQMIYDARDMLRLNN